MLEVPALVARGHPPVRDVQQQSFLVKVAAHHLEQLLPLLRRRTGVVLGCDARCPQVARIVVWEAGSGRRPGVRGRRRGRAL